jgi:hypothetical protein
MEQSTLLAYEGKLSREQLALVPTPPATATHKPIPHVEVINALTETLGFRHIRCCLTSWPSPISFSERFGPLQ